MIIRTLRGELIVIIFNCASAKRMFPLVPFAIKPAIRNCECTRARAVTKFPKLTTPKGMRKVWMLRYDSRPENFRGGTAWPQNFSFLATSQERPPRRAAPPVRGPLLSLLLRLIDRDTNEEPPNAGESERVVFNQARETENWKALEKWSTPRSESRRW